jgi:hypothetical protein
MTAHNLADDLAGLAADLPPPAADALPAFIEDDLPFALFHPTPPEHPAAGHSTHVSYDHDPRPALYDGARRQRWTHAPGGPAARSLSCWLLQPCQKFLRRLLASRRGNTLLQSHLMHRARRYATNVLRHSRDPIGAPSPHCVGDACQGDGPPTYTGAVLETLDHTLHECPQGAVAAARRQGHAALTKVLSAHLPALGGEPHTQAPCGATETSLALDVLWPQTFSSTSTTVTPTPETPEDPDPPLIGPLSGNNSL